MCFDFIDPCVPVAAFAVAIGRIVHPHRAERHPLWACLGKAIAHGAKIEIFINPKLNAIRDVAGVGNLDAAGAAFTGIGARGHRVLQLL